MQETESALVHVRRGLSSDVIDVTYYLSPLEGVRNAPNIASGAMAWVDGGLRARVRSAPTSTSATKSPASLEM
jgi:hypothetical protein